MTYAFAPTIEAAARHLVANPAALAWMAGWLAAALGIWLRAVLPPGDDEAVAIAIAGCPM